ncbi:MAG: 50S ribosomal protein L30 [Cytophagales bacterium]|jgi:large subunit ribosomal protein L30|nr:MAG: 50S ribosomal protein L30 [Rhodothermaeota bacterium MED-G16]|tara:strand:+ start:615 stop:812 length:198 start_codon:yes stop_codon:yes gene_type:complete
MAKEKKTKVSITQVKSTISQTSRQKKTITALGLGKINKTVEKLMTPQIRGMINKVNHLIEVKEVK